MAGLNGRVFRRETASGFCFRGRTERGGWGGGLEAADDHAEDAGDKDALVDDFEFEVAFAEHDHGIDKCHEGTASAYH
mgnify:FL=1